MNIRSSIELSLANHELETKISRSIDSKDKFVFISNGIKYKCRKIEAAVMSPAIYRMCRTSNTFKTYTMTTHDPEDQFELIHSLLQGEVLKVTDVNACYLYNTFKELENYSFAKKIEDYLNNNNISFNTVEKSHSYPIFRLSHHELDELVDYEPEEIAKIMNDCRWYHKNQNELFEFISDMIKEKGDGYKILLRYVNYSDLNPIFQHSYHKLNDHHKSNNISTTRCLIEFQTDESKKKVTIDYNNEPMDGLLEYLSNENEYNVEITASSSFGDPPTVVAKHNDNYFWTSLTETNPWIMFDFKDWQINPNRYALKKSIVSQYNQSWIVQGSNDMRNWIELDRQNYNSNFNDSSRAHTFYCNLNSYSFRYIKISFIGRCNSGLKSMALSGVEFFGSIYNDDINVNTC